MDVASRAFSKKQSTFFRSISPSDSSLSASSSIAKYNHGSEVCYSLFLSEEDDVEENVLSLFQCLLGELCCK